MNSDAGLTPLKKGLLTALAALALDQASKAAVLANAEKLAEGVEVAPFFNLVLAWNRGVSFSMLSGMGEAGPWILTGVGLLITAGLLFLLLREKNPWIALCLGAIIGGALGNIADRVRFGSVIDFLDFHAAGRHWPAFNVADSFISTGAALMVVLVILAEKREREKKNAQTS